MTLQSPRSPGGLCRGDFRLRGALSRWRSAGAGTPRFFAQRAHQATRSVLHLTLHSATIATAVTASDPNAPRLIVVEDSELDYELLLAMLMREGMRPRAVRAEDEAGMRDAFAQGPIDAVITDHNLPRFDSFASLKVAKSVDPDIPVIVLSGEMSEELAVASLHAGADDFVLKTRMFRVAAALQHSLAAARTRREGRNAADALLESERKLHALTQHLERAKEEERRAIAQEIHDDVGGALTALKFEVVRLAREVGTEQHRERLQAIQQLLESAVVATHRIQHALRPAVLDAGLVAALEWLTRGFGERTGLPMAPASSRTVSPSRRDSACAGCWSGPAGSTAGPRSRHRRAGAPP
jgi:signal transduction histidine kinase